MNTHFIYYIVFIIIIVKENRIGLLTDVGVAKKHNMFKEYN